MIENFGEKIDFLKNKGFTGDETTEELIKKVNQVDSIDSKIEVCEMIITYLEVKNGVDTGEYNIIVSLCKEYPPEDPRWVLNSKGVVGDTEKIRKGLESIRTETYIKMDINLFLFLLKESEQDCYLKLINKYSKKNKIENLKDSIITWSVYIGFFILIYFLVKKF